MDAIRIADIFTMDDIIVLAAVKQLHKANPELYSLLEVFTSGMLSDLYSWMEKYPAAITKYSK